MSEATPCRYANTIDTHSVQLEKDSHRRDEILDKIVTLLTDVARLQAREASIITDIAHLKDETTLADAHMHTHITKLENQAAALSAEVDQVFIEVRKEYISQSKLSQDTSNEVARIVTIGKTVKVIAVGLFAISQFLVGWLYSMGQQKVEGMDATISRLEKTISDQDVKVGKRFSEIESFNTELWQKINKK